MQATLIKLQPQWSRVCSWSVYLPCSSTASCFPSVTMEGFKLFFVVNYFNLEKCPWAVENEYGHLYCSMDTANSGQKRNTGKS